MHFTPLISLTHEGDEREAESSDFKALRYLTSELTE